MSVVEIQGSYLPRLGLEISITLFFPPKQHRTVIGCYLVNTARQSRGENYSVQLKNKILLEQECCEYFLLSLFVTTVSCKEESPLRVWSLAPNPKAPAELQGQSLMVENSHPLEYATRNLISWINGCCLGNTWKKKKKAPKHQANKQNTKKRKTQQSKTEKKQTNK